MKRRWINEPRTAARSGEGPLGGQRSTRSDERGGDVPRTAARSGEGPLGGQRSTRSDERGGDVMSAVQPPVQTSVQAVDKAEVKMSRISRFRLLVALLVAAIALAPLALGNFSVSLL